MIKNLLPLSLLFWYTLLPTNAPGQQTTARSIKKALQVLLIDGQNNHDTWKAGSTWMQGELEATGLFKVDIARTPEPGQVLSAFLPAFSKYDVVVSNYNGDPWPEATQKAFEHFVHQGGGFVVVHAADNAFPDWKAYNQMTGIGGWNGRTEKHGPYLYINDQGETIRDMQPGPGGHHGPRHEFVVQVREPRHPITRGMPEKWLHTRDELYDLMRGPAEQVEILLTAYSDPDMQGTGRHEPSAMTIRYGKGRVFHTTMGHDLTAMRCIGFITLLQRGTEWAATGKVTQPMPTNFPSATQTSSK
jgi:type 1 glutamine amidotransferase